ncbi:uncharacterized protein V1516DRAFT_690300 [Lipomyces oligophaga]|uniref:uncharacterized protein n=1 Tax=Lipomyces oligophaga TaxID=45792 RepID=UPI0034CFEC15
MEGNLNLAEAIVPTLTLISEVINSRSIKLHLDTDVYWLTALPEGLESQQWSNSWQSYLIILATNSKIRIRLSVMQDILPDTVNFNETFIAALTRSKFWAQAGLELHIPKSDQWSCFDGTIRQSDSYELNVFFSPSSLTLSTELNRHNKILPLTTLYELSINFTFRSEHYDSGILISDTQDDIGLQMLHLADRSLCALITDKLSLYIPLIFCPQYASDLLERFTIADSSLISSISSILSRRQIRTKIAELSETFSDQDLKIHLWKALTTRLLSKHRRMLKLKKFLSIDKESTVFIATTNALLSSDSSCGILSSSG